MTPSSASPDAELLAAVSVGEMDALSALYGRHAPWLAVRLARRCNDSEVVSDVLQDTFVVLWHQAETFRGDGDVGAWLWGIAVRRLVSRLRRRRLVLPLADPPEPRLRYRESAEDLALRGIEYGDLGDAMARLSPEMRAVMQATVLDGLSTKETGRLLHIPQSTVKTRLHRAKQRLRASLTEGELS